MAVERAAAEKSTIARPGPLRVGLVRSVGATSLSVRGGSALQTKLPGDKSLWTMAIRSPGAFGIRLHFSNLDVGTGSVIIYAREAGRVIAHGPYTGKGPNQTGEFWTASLPGETVFIEASGIDEPQLEVMEILHFDKNPGGSDQGQAIKPDHHQPCLLDAMCYGSAAVNSEARDAVGQMNYISGRQGFVCTGTALNDRDSETNVPYFLTARHCINTQAETNTLEVVWGWQRGSCNGLLPSYSSLPRNVGGTLLVENSGNDMAFIRLNGDLPGGVSLAGWTTGGLSPSVVGIHHPGQRTGNWKRVTFMHEKLIVSNSSLPISQYHYLQQDDGITEGGV